MSATNTHSEGATHRSNWPRQQPEVDAGAVLTALEDEGCRKILEATAETALTAPEVSDRCDIPLSTTYRKLETLAEVELLEESIRIRSSGKHATEYRKCFDDITVSLPGDGEFTLEISSSTAEESLVAVGQ